MSTEEEKLFKEYTRLYLQERRQSAILTGKGPAYSFKSDIEWKRLKSDALKFISTIRNLVASTLDMLGSIIITGKGFAEIALNSLGRLFGKPPKGDQIILSQRESLNKLRSFTSAVRGTPIKAGTSDSLSENIEFGQILMEQSIAEDDFINTVTTSVANFVSEMNDIQSGGNDLDSSISTMEKYLDETRPYEISTIFDKSEAERLSGESISESDMTSIRDHISDNFLPSTVDSFASTSLSDAAAKIIVELEEVNPDLIPIVRSIYDKAISEFQ